MLHKCINIYIYIFKWQKWNISRYNMEHIIIIIIINIIMIIDYYYNS